MAVYALWSAARSRSTAFFRSMLERSDLLALHEPLEGLSYIGPIEVGGERFETPESLIAWLLDEVTESVFIKETLSSPVMNLVRSHDRFLAEVRHAFLIRRPEEIAASFFALEGDMRIDATGVRSLHELYLAVSDAGGHRPVVVDSDDLLAHPEATMRAFCDAVGLTFEPDALTWEAGVRPEWSRTARWHEDASASTGFVQPTEHDRHSLADHPDVRRFATRHDAPYRALEKHKLRVDPSEA